VAEIATAGVADNDKTVAELSRTVTLLVDKLTAKDATTATPPAAPTVAAVTSERDNNDRQPRRQQYTSSYNRSRGQPGRQQQQRPQFQRNFGYQRQDRTATSSGQPCGNCLTFHDANRCPAFAQTCYNCNRRNHFARACRSRPQRQQMYNQH
jgi:hypothetical protein